MKKEAEINKKVEQLFLYHPCISLFTLLIAMPIMILLTVTISTAIIVLPISYLFG